MSEPDTGLLRILERWGIEPEDFAGRELTITVTHADLMKLIMHLDRALGEGIVAPGHIEDTKALLSRLDVEGFRMFREIATKVPPEYQDGERG